MLKMASLPIILVLVALLLLPTNEFKTETEKKTEEALAMPQTLKPQPSIKKHEHELTAPMTTELVNSLLLVCQVA